MRIIAGKYRRRLLLSPPKSVPTRPIPDRVKESIFSILRGNIENARVLDVFAGTGALGLEAISRGAAECVFIERDKKAADVLERNVQALGCGDQASVVRADALGPAVLTRLSSMGGADLVFFDPPYPLVLDGSPPVSGVGGGGWARVRAQLERCIAQLSDHGYLLLRTPWPFRHPDEPPASHGSESGESADGDARRPPGKHRPRKRRSEVDERDLETEWIGSEIDIEEIQRQTRELEERFARRTPRPTAGSAGGPGMGIKRHLTNKDLQGDESDLADEGGGEGGFFEDGLDDGDAAFDHDPADGDLRDGGGPGGASAEGGAPGVKFHMVDLALAGAVGPETHVYGSTAVHLYMRKR